MTAEKTLSAPSRGVVYVQSKDLPAIVKLVPAGESTAVNAGSLIPSRPAGRRGPGAAGPPAMAARIGRTVYEQSCQGCHRADLKGDRGPAVEKSVAALGADSVRNTVSKGQGGMPPIAAVTPPLMNNLIAFPTIPETAPPGSGLPPGGRGGRRGDPDYPPGVEPPPSRYVTGYGQEAYVITSPWSTITAYDLNAGKIKWQVPCGDLPEAGPGPMRGNVYPKGGIVVTAGGLIFFTGNEGKLYAYDKETGKVVFTKDVPNGSAGVPAAYKTGGRQYLLFAIVGGNNFPAGGKMPPGGVAFQGTSKSYIAFALPK
jgi:quinoprotein glucose dehydrogenase